MPILDYSSALYTTSGGASYKDAAFALSLVLDGELEAISYNPYKDAEFDGAIDLVGELDAEKFYPGDARFDGNLQLLGDLIAESVLALVEPTPITETVSADAFSNQRYADGGGRLFINNVQTKFVRAEINAPRKSLGKTLRIELANANLALLPSGATFKFQIGKIVAGVPVWTTILDGGKLEGRSFQMAVGRDSLQFSTTAGTDKLNLCPKNNLIVFDPAKGSVSGGEVEAVPTNTGEFITTQTQAVGVLSLYKLLNIAFVAGCGFASVKTDIPNYEIARCDFSVANSYASAVAGFVGMYEPEFSIDASNNLTIRKTINPLPLSFTPNALYASFSKVKLKSVSKF